MMQAHNEGIIITKTVGKYFVWDPDHVYKLRTDHRICGALVGSLPRKPWQTSINSMPMVLMPVEAKLCQKRKIAKIQRSEDYFSKRVSPIVSLYQEEKVRNEHEQIRVFKAEKREKERLYRGSAKRKKCKTRINLQDQSSVSVSGDNDISRNRIDVAGCFVTKNDFKIGVNNDKLSTNELNTRQDDDKFALLNTETDVKQHNSESNSKSCVSDDSLSENDMKYYQSSLRIYIPTVLKNQSVLDDCESEILTTDNDRLHYKVFEDLWLKQYYITSAEKFGGDFLVYPADPLRFHSHFIVHVKKKGEKFSSKDMIGYGRLAVSVKKTLVIATVSDDFMEVSYTSLGWVQMKS